MYVPEILVSYGDLRIRSCFPDLIISSSYYVFRHLGCWIVTNSSELDSDLHPICTLLSGDNEQLSD